VLVSDKEPTLSCIVYSDDQGKLHLYYIDDAGGYRSPAYDSIVTESITSELGRVAFVARRPDGTVVVNFNRQEIPANEALGIADLVVSPDGRRCAFVEVMAAEINIVLDGRRIDRTSNAAFGLAFSSNGEHLVYCVYENDDGEQEGEVSVRLDGRAVGFLAGDVGGLSVSNTGRWGAATRGRGQLGVEVVVDGVVYGPYAGVWDVGIQFSDDGRRWYCIVGDADDENVLLVDGVERYRGVCVYDAVWYRAGDIAYSVRVGGRTEVFGNHISWGAYDAVGPFLRVSDERIAFLARSDARCFWVVNGTAGDQFDDVHDPYCGERGRFAYAGRTDGEERIVLHDRGRSAPYAQVHQLLVTEEGAVVGVVARADGTQCLIQGRGDRWSETDFERGWQFVNGSLRRGASGGLAYVVRDTGGGHARVVVNGVAGPGYDDVWSCPVVVNGQTAIYVGRAGDAFVEVQQRVQ
jgi:hypothetical protein